MSRHETSKPSNVMWLRKGMKKGKVLTRLNNGWIMLEFEDGKKNRYPPSMLTDKGPQDEEKAAEPPKAAPAAAAVAPVQAAALPSQPPPPVQQYAQQPVYQNNVVQPVPMFSASQLGHQPKLPEPNAGVGEVQQWLHQNGFGNFVKDAQSHSINGWSFRYLQHVAKTSTPKEFGQIMRHHFPRMTIGQISSMGGRLIYKPGETAWD